MGSKKWQILNLDCFFYARPTVQCMCLFIEKPKSCFYEFGETYIFIGFSESKKLGFAEFTIFKMYCIKNEHLGKYLVILQK